MKVWKGRLTRFHRLSLKMKLLCVIAYFLMGIIRLGIIVFPFKYIAPILGEKNKSSLAEVERSVLVHASKISFAVETMSRFTPWESKCLVRAITAQLLLRVVRTPSTLYLGMSRDSSNKLIAHAWLRCGEFIMTGASESKNFKSVAQFASLMSRETKSRGRLDK